jgi:hypothetical protein
LAGPLLVVGLGVATTGTPLGLVNATATDADAETALGSDADATVEGEAAISVAVEDPAVDAETEAAAVCELAAEVAAGDWLNHAVPALALAAAALTLGE